MEQQFQGNLSDFSKKKEIDKFKQAMIEKYITTKISVNDNRSVISNRTRVSQ